MRFNESPDPIPAGMLQTGFEAKVMHSSFTIHDVRLMATDGGNDQTKFGGFQLALTVATEAEAHTAFDALAAEGTPTLVATISTRHNLALMPVPWWGSPVRKL